MSDPIIAAMFAEIDRAEQLHGPLPMDDCTASLFFVFADLERQARRDLDHAPSALAILAEEVGELGTADTDANRRTEAIQCMAVLYRYVKNLEGK